MAILCRLLEVGGGGGRILSIFMLDVVGIGLRLFWIVHVGVLMFASIYTKIRMIASTAPTAYPTPTTHKPANANAPPVAKTAKNPKSGTNSPNAHVHAHSQNNAQTVNTTTEDSADASACQLAANSVTRAEDAET